MVLGSRHPGVTIDQIKTETGWPLKQAENVGETLPPTAAELAAIQKYDPKKIWTS